MSKEYNEDFFEMNKLDSVNSINLDVQKNKGSSHSQNVDKQTDKSNNTDSGKASAVKSDNAQKKCKKNAILLCLLAASAVICAGALIVGLFGRTHDEVDPHYDLKETPFVTDSDSPGIDQISENVLGTGMLFSDCDIFRLPDESSSVEGRLSGGTDVLIYEAEGDFYKVSDPDKVVTGYVLKEKVNTGNIDLGNPDAASEIIDDNTGEVIGTEKINSNVTNATINPEDFPVNSSPYFIYVEKGSHTITIFGKDSNGKYTIPRKTFLTATGRTASLTPVGNFTIKGKEKWHSWGTCYSPYCCKYYGGLFFHGSLYKSKNFGSLMRGSVAQIGTNASSGCMRTSAQAAYFIYQFCWVGTNVKIVNGSPLGRSAGRPSEESQYIDPATNCVPVAEISFGFDSKTMIIGDSLKVNVNISPAFADNTDCSWSSSNPSVVSVNGDGNSCTLTAKKEGSAVITATSIDGGFTASFNVNVLPPESSDESSDIPPDSSTEPDGVSSTESDTSSENTSSDSGDSTTETDNQETAPSSSTSAVTSDDSQTGD